LMPGTFPGSASSGAASRPAASATTPVPRFEVNMDEPNTSIQIRLADGTRSVNAEYLGTLQLKCVAGWYVA
jgi:UBX domain-containing protein 1